MDNNKKRVARIKAVLNTYREALYGDPQESEDTDIRDMLTDIMHYCHKHGIDFDHELSMATDHFGEEVTRARR